MFDECSQNQVNITSETRFTFDLPDFFYLRSNETFEQSVGIQLAILFSYFLN